MSNVSDQIALLEKRLQTGKMLQQLRLERNESLADVCSKIKVSKNYLSEIERGLKVPSDQLILDLADHYNINHHDLFQSFGKVPISAREELEKFDNLQRTLGDIHRDKRLNDDQKQELYDELYRLYRKLLDEND